MGTWSVHKTEACIPTVCSIAFLVCFVLRLKHTGLYLESYNRAFVFGWYTQPLVSCHSDLTVQKNDCVGMMTVQEFMRACMQVCGCLYKDN